MKSSIPVACLSASSLFLAGCASSADDIAASYVSPYTYQSYTCAQLADEMEQINARVHQVTGTVNSAATNDKVAMGVGLVIFWPALFMLKGNGPEQEELARLKGQYDAVNESLIRHNCNSTQPTNSADTSPPASGSAIGDASVTSGYSRYSAKVTTIVPTQHATTVATPQATISGAISE